MHTHNRVLFCFFSWKYLPYSKTLVKANTGNIYVCLSLYMELFTFKIRIVVVRYILQFTDLCDYLSVSFCYLVFQISFFLNKNLTVFTALWRTSLVQHCIERHFSISCDKGDRNVKYLVAGMQETKKSTTMVSVLFYFLYCGIHIRFSDTSTG